MPDLFVEVDLVGGPADGGVHRVNARPFCCGRPDKHPILIRGHESEGRYKVVSLARLGGRALWVPITSEQAPLSSWQLAELVEQLARPDASGFGGGLAGVSVKVTTAVYDHSEARLAARLVLLAIADYAEEISGLAYPPIIDHPETPPEKFGSIAFKTRLSEREVRNSLRELEQLDELETRQAQRGRGRINVYRVKVGYLREREAAIDKLPFQLLAPFSTPGIDCRQSEEGLPAEDRVDYRQSATGTTGTHTRARVKTGPPKEPSLNPLGEREGLDLELRLAFSVVLGAEPQTPSERRRWDAAITELAGIGATAAEVAERCRAWPFSAPFTPEAIVRHWGILGAHVAASAPEAEAHDRIERWLTGDGWRLDPDDIRTNLEGAGFSADAIGLVLARAAEIRAERTGAESVVRDALDASREAAA